MHRCTLTVLVTSLFTFAGYVCIGISLREHAMKMENLHFLGLDLKLILEWLEDVYL